MSMTELTREELKERLKGIVEALSYIEHEGHREDAEYYLHEINSHIEAQDKLLVHARKALEEAGGDYAVIRAIREYLEER